ANRPLRGGAPRSRALVAATEDDARTGGPDRRPHRRFFARISADIQAGAWTRGIIRAGTEADMTAQDVTQPPLQVPPAESAGVGAQKRGRLRIIPLLGLMVIAAAGVFVWRTFFIAPPIPDSIVTLSGRIEGDDSAIAPKVNGKILRVTVREGDSVRQGDVIAI